VSVGLVAALCCCTSSLWLALNRQGHSYAAAVAVVLAAVSDAPTALPCVQDGWVAANSYPHWDYFPRNVRPPEWVEPFVAEVRAIELRISTVD
jgi:hypothetical protein